MKIPLIEFTVKDVARINSRKGSKVSHTQASHTIVNWYKEGLIKMASDKTWRRA